MHSSYALEEGIWIGYELDPFLPTQIFDILYPAYTTQPEKRLMLAVLENAISVFQDSFHTRTKRGRRLFRETQEWFHSTDESWLFSFENICEVVGLNANFLRKGLTRWKYAQLVQSQKLKPRHMHSHVSQRPQPTAVGAPPSPTLTLYAREQSQIW